MKLINHMVQTFPLSSLLDKKRILIYPAASGAEYLLSFFRERHPQILDNIVGLGDKDSNKTSLRQNGIRIYAPHQLPALNPDVILVTSPALYPAMKQELSALLGSGIPILLADCMEEYLSFESERSALVKKTDNIPLNDQMDGPEDSSWYLCMPFGHGRFANSYKAALTYRMLDQIKLPHDLTGKSVLDLAASDGFYSFECEARNAASVTAVEGPGWETGPGLKRFLFARSFYNSKVQHAVSRVEDFIDNADRTYDIVLSLGIYYHLRDPLTYFEKLHGLTNEMLIVTGRTIAISAYDPINVAYDQIHGANPGVYTGKSASIMMLSDKKVGKWTANVTCLLDMLRIAGFSDVEVLYDHCPAGSLVSSTAIAAYK